MSLFTESSLCLVPSGVKEDKVYSIKPTDGSGDLTFSRGSDIEATRVASNGYIQKAAVNLLLQSNQYDTTWTTTDSSVTSGQAGYDGSNDAWLLENTAAGGYIRQDIILSGVQTLSVYAKAGTLDFIRIRSTVSGTNVDAYFDLSTGTYAGTAVGTAIDATITSMGSGWYRCTLTYNESITSVRIYPAIAYNDLTATSGNIYIQDAQVNYGLVAQEYQETTTTSVVSGITNDLARLDYSGGASCPSLLLEPSRQNLLAHSEYYNGFTLGNSSVSTNYGSSPEGVNNATALIEDTANAEHTLGYTLSAANTTAYTTSVFVKPNGRTQVRFGFTAAGFASQSRAYFDIQEGTILSEPVANSARIEPYADGWYRISITNTTNASANISCILQPALNESGSYQGDGTSGILVYGSTHELGSYPTFYIPCYGTSATRTADACSKTGISSLIGQTEGVLFADFVVNGRAQNANILNSEKNTISSFFLGAKANGQIDAGLFENSANVARITAGNVSVGQRAKVAYAYKSGDSALYVNGTLVGTSSQAFTLPSTLDDLFFNDTATYFNYQENVSFNQALLFKTRLTNAQLAELTAL